MWKIVKGVQEASNTTHFPILGKGQDIGVNESSESKRMALDLDLLV